MTLLLIRHGMTDAVGHKLVGRTPGVSLNTVGAAQMQTLGRRLATIDLAAVYTSPLERAVQSATEIALPHGLDVVIRPMLTEIDFGAWTGKSLTELRDDPAFSRFNSARSTNAPPNGEHSLELQRRMVLELSELSAAHPERCVAVVSHADPLRAALTYFLGMPLDLLGRLEVEPGSVSRLELSPFRTCVLSLNEKP
jgi:broad specificity phosphatase PhoE